MTDAEVAAKAVERLKGCLVTQKFKVSNDAAFMVSCYADDIASLLRDREEMQAELAEALDRRNAAWAVIDTQMDEADYAKRTIEEMQAREARLVGILKRVLAWKDDETVKSTFIFAAMHHQRLPAGFVAEVNAMWEEARAALAALKEGSDG